MADLLSASIFDAWDDSSTEEVVKAYSSIKENRRKVRRLFHHILSQMLNEKISPTKATECTAAVYNSLSSENEDEQNEDLEENTMCKKFSSILVDLLWLFDHDTGSHCLKSSKRHLLIQFIKEILNLNIVDSVLLKGRLEPTLLEETSVIPSESFWSTFTRRTRTKLVYKQNKFNLIQEESEGYSKLMVLLTTPCTSRIKDLSPFEEASVVSGQVKALIGYFDLDPNRVLNIFLEAFEVQVEVLVGSKRLEKRIEFFISLLNLYGFTPKKISALLGFRYKHFYKNEKKTPISFSTVTALLLKNNQITLEDIVPYLKPNLEDMKKRQKTIDDDAKAAAESLEFVSLNVDEKDKDDSISVDDIKQREYESFKVSFKDDLVRDGEMNQFVGLAVGLLQQGDWNSVYKILNALPQDIVIAYPTFYKLLQNTIHNTIAPLYDQIRPKGTSNSKRISDQLSDVKAPFTVDNHDDFFEKVLPMLTKLGSYMDDFILFVKVCRIGKYFISEGLKADKTEKDEERMETFIDFIMKSLVPALSLAEFVPSLAEEFWVLLLSDLPQEVRFNIYALWLNSVFQAQPMLVVQKAHTSFEIRRWLKRISSDKSKVKELGRQLSKLSCSVPIIVFSQLIERVKISDNFLGTIIDSCKYLTSLSRDVISFCLVHGLCGDRRPFYAEDGQVMSSWHKAMTSFAAQNFKRYKSECTALLMFVAKETRNNNLAHITLIGDLITHMSGIEKVQVELMSDAQIEVLAGGPILRQQEAIVSTKNMSSSTKRFKDDLVSSKIIVPFLINLAQERTRLLYASTSQRRMQRSVYDSVNDVLMQYIEFLQSAWMTSDGSLSEYEKLLPPAEDLFLKYNLDRDIAFSLIRIPMKEKIRQKEIELDQGTSRTQSLQAYISAVKETIQPLVEIIKKTFPKVNWDHISPELYVIFWILSYDDLKFPGSSYDAKIKELNSQISDMTNSRFDGDKKKLTETVKKLEEEKKSQEKIVEKNRALINEEAKNWFSNAKKTDEGVYFITSHFYQMCIAPRRIFSIEGALFSEHFTRILESAPGSAFPALQFHELIFYEIIGVITSSSNSEMERYKYYLFNTLRHLGSFHMDKELYEKKSITYSTPGQKRRTHVEFRQRYCLWQERLAMKFSECLKEDYDTISARNSLVLLNKILPEFPKVKIAGTHLLRATAKLKDFEAKRISDLASLTKNYHSALQNIEYSDKFIELRPVQIQKQKQLLARKKKQLAEKAAAEERKAKAKADEEKKAEAEKQALLEKKKADEKAAEDKKKADEKAANAAALKEKLLKEAAANKAAATAKKSTPTSTSATPPPAKTSVPSTPSTSTSTSSTTSSTTSSSSTSTRSSSRLSTTSKSGSSSKSTTNHKSAPSSPHPGSSAQSSPRPASTSSSSSSSSTSKKTSSSSQASPTHPSSSPSNSSTSSSSSSSSGSGKGQSSSGGSSSVASTPATSSSSSSSSSSKKESKSSSKDKSKSSKSGKDKKSKSKKDDHKKSSSSSSQATGDAGSLQVSSSSSSSKRSSHSRGRSSSRHDTPPPQSGQSKRRRKEDDEVREPSKMKQETRIASDRSSREDNRDNNRDDRGERDLGNKRRHESDAPDRKRYQASSSSGSNAGGRSTLARTISRDVNFDHLRDERHAASGNYNNNNNSNSNNTNTGSGSGSYSGRRPNTRHHR